MGALAIAFAALNGLIAVGAGAWAAHGADPSVAELARTASTYQMFHALALFGTGLYLGRPVAGMARRLLLLAALAFALGIVLFSGSLYSLVLGGPSFLAPVGGITLMAGWLALAVAALLELGPGRR